MHESFIFVPNDLIITALALPTTFGNLVEVLVIEHVFQVSAATLRQHIIMLIDDE